MNRADELTKTAKAKKDEKDAEKGFTAPKDSGLIDLHQPSTGLQIMKTNAQLIRIKASQASTLEEAQRLEAIAAYEESMEAEAVELDLEPLSFDEEEETTNNSNTKTINTNEQQHILSNGYMAVRNGKGFDVYKDGEFKLYAIRLKVAKDYAKKN